jgi:hypothetical protein
VGQLLAVHSTVPELTAAVFQRGLALFRSLSRLAPFDQVGFGTITAAAVFAPLRSCGHQIWRSREGGWLSWAGPCLAGDALGGTVEGLGTALTGAKSEANTDRILSGVDGSFVLALSGPDGSLRVITDRLGTLHAYTTTVDGAVVIATSSAVLAALRDADWNLTSCREFLATGTVFGQRCLFRDIDKLPPASVLTFADGREASRSRYWRIEDVTRTYDSKSDAAALADALSTALNQVRRVYPHAVLDLTGGLDSRALLATALRSSVNFDTVVCGHRDDADVVVAGRIAERFRLRHQHVEPATFESLDEIREVLPLCDGEYDLFEYARIAAIHTRLAAQYDASVNGSNGELAKGYWWELLFPFTGSRRFDADRVAARRFAFMRDPDLLDATFDSTLAEHFGQLIRESNSRMQGRPNTALMDNVYLTLRMQHWQGRIASATNRIWPAVSPFSFRACMEVALPAPPKVRLRNRMSRRLIELCSPELAGMPLANGTPAVPLRPATSGVWASTWLRSRNRNVYPSPGDRNGKLSNEVRELLKPDEMITAALFRQDALARAIHSSLCDAPGRTVVGRIVTLEILARLIRSAARRAVRVHLV